ncbi:hypothetical protein K439DRAFT_1658963 [Ramaria rubella]|nr:hypothetical protein K439DRAFT_1658963 [Ramaria rubella]
MAYTFPYSYYDHLEPIPESQDAQTHTEHIYPHITQDGAHSLLYPYRGGPLLEHAHHQGVGNENASFYYANHNDGSHLSFSNSLVSPSSSSRFDHQSQPEIHRHELRRVHGTVPDEEIDKYLARKRGENLYYCSWPIQCLVHAQHKHDDSVTECQWTICSIYLKASKENARIHVREVHLGETAVFSCSVCGPTKTFMRKADAKRHCDGMNARLEGASA